MFQHTLTYWCSVGNCGVCFEANMVCNNGSKWSSEQTNIFKFLLRTGKLITIALFLLSCGFAVDSNWRNANQARRFLQQSKFFESLLGTSKLITIAFHSCSKLALPFIPTGLMRIKIDIFVHFSPKHFNPSVHFFNIMFCWFAKRTVIFVHFSTKRVKPFSIF